MDNSKSLATILRRTMRMNWYDFLEVRRSNKNSVRQNVVISLINLCVKQKPSIGAISEAFNRISGQPINVIVVTVPSVYTLYVDAKTKAKAPEIEESTSTELVVAEPKEENYDDIRSEITLREILKRTMELPAGVIQAVVEAREACEHGAAVPYENAPTVGAVIISSLLESAFKNDQIALMEIFDQVDGKLAQTYAINQTENVYVKDYSEVAPYNAIKNEDGVYMLKLDYKER